MWGNEVNGKGTVPDHLMHPPVPLLMQSADQIIVMQQVSWYIVKYSVKYARCQQ
jgi:hypothetical protein